MEAFAIRVPDHGVVSLLVTKIQRSEVTGSLCRYLSSLGGSRELAEN